MKSDEIWWNLMKSDEIWWKPCFHQISSDFIRFHQISSELFFLVTTFQWNKKHIENQTKPKKHASTTTLHCSHFEIKAPSVQPFCFCSNGEANEGYEKSNEINLCKGEANLWEGESNPCQREQDPCKGEASLCKGETFEKRCSPESNLEEKQLAKVGAAVPSGQNQKKSQKPMMMNMKQPRSCKIIWQQQKKAGLGPNTRLTSTRMAMRKKGMHSTMHQKMKRESWQPFSSWERKLPSSAMLAGPLAPSKRWPWQKNCYQKKKPLKNGEMIWKSIAPVVGCSGGNVLQLGGSMSTWTQWTTQRKPQEQPKGPGPKARSSSRMKMNMKVGTTSWKRSCTLWSWIKPLGRGKGKARWAKKKGKGRGKGDTNSEAPKALEDMPPDEQQVECLKKLKKTRDLLQQCLTNYEEALEKVKGMQYLTKPAFKAKEAQLSKLEAALGKVKKQLAKGDKGKVNITKDLLKEAVATMSEAKEEAKELVQISMKTQSKSSRKWTHGRILAKGVRFCKRGNHLCKRVGPKKGLVVCARLSPPLQCMCEHIYTFVKGGTFAKGGGKWTSITQQLFHKGWVTGFLIGLGTKAPGTDQPTCAKWLLLAVGASWGCWVVLVVVCN